MTGLAWRVREAVGVLWGSLGTLKSADRSILMRTGKAIRVDGTVFTIRFDGTKFHIRVPSDDQRLVEVELKGHWAETGEWNERPDLDEESLRAAVELLDIHEIMGS